MLHITKRVAGGEFCAEEGADFAGSKFVDVVLLVRKEANHTSHAKSLARTSDGHSLPFDESARIDAHKTKSGVTVEGHLEAKRRKR